MTIITLLLPTAAARGVCVCVCASVSDIMDLPWRLVQSMQHVEHTSQNSNADVGEDYLRQTHAKLICSETTGGGGENGFKHPTINSSSASTQEGTESTGG